MAQDSLFIRLCRIALLVQHLHVVVGGMPALAPFGERTKGTHEGTGAS